MSRMVFTPVSGPCSRRRADRDLERHGVGHAALLALVDVVLQLHPDRVAADVADVAARLVLLAAARAEHDVVAVRIGNQRRAAVLQGLRRWCRPASLPHLHSQLPIEYSMNSSDEFSRKSLIGNTDLKTTAARRLALGRQPVHLQEALVRLRWNLDQVREWEPWS
jgi:hypothetical protein